MKNLAALCFLAFLAIGSASASSVTYSGVSVSCKETSHALTTETLSITFDDTTNGGKFGGGAIGTNSCAFQLTNQVVFPPFVNGTYTYNAGVAGNQDTVCWASEFCNVAGTTDSLVIASAVPTGSLFTIISGSITTTFTITSPVVNVNAAPEPSVMALSGIGLLALGTVLRRRKNATA